MTHRLLAMPDGHILDYESDGVWRLWNYDAGSADILPGNPVASGKWSSIGGADALTVMPDGHILDVQPDGSWRLWNYDPSSRSDVLPGDPVAKGSWATIRGDAWVLPGNLLVPMRDGHALDVGADGGWRLWNYDANSADVLPGDPVASGKWASIDSSHRLLVMPDGHILDWVPDDGTWRLWNYDPNSTADILPGAPVASGKWASISDAGPKELKFRTDIVFDDGTAVGGWAQLTLQPDGSYTYEGKMWDSGVVDYHVSNAWVVVDRAGTAYTGLFHGFLHGRTPIVGGDDDEDPWTIEGKNEHLSANWSRMTDAVCHWQSGANPDYMGMLNDLISDVKTATEIVTTIALIAG